MRPVRLVIMVLTAALAAGSARLPPPQVAVDTAAAPVVAVSPLDTIAYGGTRGFTSAPAAIPVAITRAAPQNAYTLDSGDKLRVVVFGQDGLTNSYIVDAGGHITMLLIGSASRRAGSRPISSRPRSRRGCARASSATRRLPSRSRPIGRSLFSARLRIRASIPTCPT